jgi:hypothetical protein
LLLLFLFLPGHNLYIRWCNNCLLFYLRWLYHLLNRWWYKCILFFFIVISKEVYFSSCFLFLCHHWFVHNVFIVKCTIPFNLWLVVVLLIITLRHPTLIHHLSFLLFLLLPLISLKLSFFLISPSLSFFLFSLLFL